MARLPAIAGVVAPYLLGSLAAHAETTAVTREVKGDANQDIRIGAYINVSADCKSGPLPTIRLRTPPQHGKVTVRQTKIRATNYKQCLALEVPGYIAFYRSSPSFRGTDELTLEIAFPHGRSETQTIKVTIGGPVGQKI